MTATRRLQGVDDGLMAVWLIGVAGGKRWIFFGGIQKGFG